MTSQAITNRANAISPDRSQGLKLKFVPISGRSHEHPKYELLRQETLAFVQVTEISEGGSVSELRVENKLDERVFLMDGQELVGAKQNRILNTDVLIPAYAALTGLILYAKDHDDQWPDKLEDLKDILGGAESFKRVMTNPLTGDAEGYIYLKPAGKMSALKDAGSMPIIYEAKAGQKNEAGPIGYADGHVANVRRMLTVPGGSGGK